MKKKLQKYFLSCLILLSINSLATTASTDLSQLLGDFQSLTANFEQTIYDANDKIMQKNSGSMALHRPGKFRWQVTQPNSQLLIADGKYLWIYDEDLSQVTRQKLNNNKANSPASLLSGSEQDLESRFKITSLGNQTFKLVPKNANDLFKWIELGFENDTLSFMRLADNLDSLSLFKFTSVILNPRMPASVFEFEPPKGVDLIQQ